VKVLYDDCGSAKWVPPAEFGSELKRADFMVGDAVSVLCRSMGLWVTDGSVDEVLSEASRVDDLAMPAGSLKVTYASGDMVKWIPPAAFGVEVRALRQWSGFGTDEDDGEDCSTTGSEGAATPRREISEPTELSDNFERLPSVSEQRHASSFSMGDPVCVFRRSVGAWSRDGTVVKHLAEPTLVEDGILMPAGSVKVLYGNLSSAKWIPPAEFGMELKQADFMVGDGVSVLCRSMGLWVSDGLVVDELLETNVVDGGLTMPAGSLKVTYASGNMAKWIPPETFSEELRVQRPCSGEGEEDQSSTVNAEGDEPETLEASDPTESPAAAHPPSSIVRSLSRLLPVMSFVSNQEASVQVDDDDEGDAYIVSGASGVASSFLGRYRRVGEHNDRPKYRNQHGAILYFDEHWKINSKDDVLHWCFEVRAAAGDQPPTQDWAVYRFYGDRSSPVPTVTRAADLEVLAVSGVMGSARTVNGRYVEAGLHNEKPKYKNSSGAIIFFDGYWKMNDRDDVLAWYFSVKDGGAGPLPPAGPWAAHWSVGKDQPPAVVKVCGGSH